MTRAVPTPPDRVWVDSSHWYPSKHPVIHRHEYVRADIFSRELEKLRQEIKKGQDG